MRNKPKVSYVPYGKEVDVGNLIDMCRAWPAVSSEEIEKEHSRLLREVFGPPILTIKDLKRRKQKMLDHICTICGSVGKISEKVEDRMVSPWHCKFCECPECGRSSKKIRLKKEGSAFYLCCPCGWKRCVSNE